MQPPEKQSDSLLRITQNTPSPLSTPRWMKIKVGAIKDNDLARFDSGADFRGANTGGGLAPSGPEVRRASETRLFRPRGEANHMSAVLV
jgi:hypothetical protein